MSSHESDNRLSVYITESIRQRKLEHEQARSLHAALDELGIPNGENHEGDPLSAQHRAALERGRRTKDIRATIRNCQSRIRHGQKVERIRKRAIIDRDGPNCYLCDKALEIAEMELEHVIPLSRGGDHTMDNVKIACAPCNCAKGTKTLDEYQAQISPA